ncbi:MAG: HAD-IA family hydrolase [Polyangiaceae bacterium]
MRQLTGSRKLEAPDALRPAAVLFDYDDTLVQTRLCKYRALRALGSRHYGLQLSDAEIDRHWGIAYVELFRQLFGAVEPQLERAIQRYEALDAEFSMTAYPEALPVLRALASRMPIGIVTAAGRSIVERQLNLLGFPPLAVLQTAEDTPHHKPDPRVFAPALACLRALGVESARVHYVGDSLKDFEAARGAGLTFVGILRGTTRPEEFAAAGAETVESLDALLERL